MDDEPPPDARPRAAAAVAVRDLTAARLARGFLPLGALFVVGLAEVVVSGGSSRPAWLLLVGAPLSAGVMLLQGLHAVRRALSTGSGGGWVAAAGAVPVAWGVWVLVALGLRPLVGGAGSAGAFLLALLLVALAGRFLWMLWRLTEVRRLAAVMAEPAPGEGAGAGPPPPAVGDGS